MASVPAPPAGARAVPATSLTFDAASFPRKLNLGCGWDLRAGFVNVDLYDVVKPDVVSDLRRLRFLPRGHYDEIVAQDVLEHLPRLHTGPVLAHWSRLLRPGGTIFIRVPNLLVLGDIFRQRDWQAPEKQQELMHCLFGTQAYNGDFHLTSFTPVLLRDYLERAGFRVKRLEVVETWLLDALATKEREVEGPQVVDPREFAERGLDDAAFVRSCYTELLEREPDPGGYRHHVRAVRSGAMGRQAMAASFLESGEYLALQARA